MCELSEFVFPFRSISNYALSVELFGSKVYNDLIENEDIKALTYSNDILKELDFKYYTGIQCKSLLNSVQKNLNLSIFHVNIRSLNANYRNLIEFINSNNFDFDIIILSEIWSLNLDCYKNLFSGFEFFYQCSLSRAGGVGIYCKTSLNPTPRADLSHCDANFESSFIDVISGKTKFSIGGFYRHPNTPINDFMSTFSEIINRIQNKNTAIFGDFNIDLNKYNNDVLVQGYVDALIAKGLLPYTYLPTRVSRNSATIIDHVFSNCHSNFKIKSGLAVADLSDHLGNFLLILNNNSSHSLCKNRPFIRVYNKQNINNFMNYVSSFNWSQIYSFNDCDTAFNYFHKTIQNLHDTAFPLVKISRKKFKDKPWITAALKQSINTKYFLYKKYLTNRRELDEIAYKNYRNKLRHLLKVAERNYYSNILNSKLNNIKNIWQHINQIIGNRKSKTIPTVSKLNVNGNHLSDSQLIANAFNDYFASIGQNLAQGIPSNGDNFRQYLCPANVNSFFFNDISGLEVSNVINSLKSSKSPGPDNICSFIIKLANNYICFPLSYLFNLCMLNGIFPSVLKTSKVIPLYKKGCKSEICNYRPITLSSVISKVFEKLIYSRMNNFINNYDLFYKSQYGFRVGHSTTFAVIDVTEMINKELQNGNYVMGIFLDITKAFDSVCHDILLHKLYNYGFRGNIYNLLKSYLSDRYIFTCINGKISSTTSINYGVPQGSVLGPLLFLLYINDMPNCIPGYNLKIFADDSNVFVVDNNPCSLYSKANYVLSQLYTWCNTNKLQISIPKSCYMLFKPTRELEHAIINYSLNLHINYNSITRTESFKYLGVWFDCNLSWKEHVNKLISKLNSYIGLFYKSKYYLPLDCRRNLYFAMVQSNLSYCVEVYGNANKTTLNRLFISCNRVLRSLQYVDKETHVLELYKNFSALNIYNLYKFNMLKLMYKCVNFPSLVPTNFSNIFVPNSRIHNYNTRGANNIHLVNSFNGYSIVFKMSSLWNNLPSHIKELPSFSTYCNEVKKYLSV